MPRPPLHRTEHFAYHVTVRSNNKEWFYIPMPECWKILTDCLGRTATEGEAEIHTFVLMSNHFHLLISTPKKNLGEIMRNFLTQATHKIQKVSGRINHIFGARYRWTILDNAYSLAYVYKYICRNPIRAGSCHQVQDYPFNALNTLDTAAPIFEGIGSYWQSIPRNYQARLTWLNSPTKKELETLIGRALRRYRFSFTTCSNLQKDLRNLRQAYGIETNIDAPLPLNT